MTRRYFVADMPHRGGEVTLSPDESAHAAKVMRVQVGDSLELFDGRGHQATAEFVSVSRKACVCQVHPATYLSREPDTALHLAVALPKPDRAKEMIERLTELGVVVVTPLVCQRTQRPPSTGLIDKLQRQVIEASKQCGRNHLMTLLPVCTLTEFLAGLSTDQTTHRWIAHPGGTPIAQLDHQRDVQSVDSTNPEEIASKRPTVLALVGPEGGFDDDEVSLARQHGFAPVGLGNRIYRIETAAVTIAARLAV